MFATHKTVNILCLNYSVKGYVQQLNSIKKQEYATFDRLCRSVNITVPIKKKQGRFIETL